MFDIGFLEILVILIIALMVIGPARMPEVARKIGQFTGKTKRFIHSMKEDSEISDAIREMKDSLNIEEEKKALQEISSDLQEDMQSIHQEWGVDKDINRPSFSEHEDATPIEGSQFNKAPRQPDISKIEQSAEVDTVSDTMPELTDNIETISAEPEPDKVAQK